MLQDDAWPCENFADTIHAAIAERPKTVLCAFVPGFGHVTRPVQQARKAGQRWMPWRVRAFVPLVAIVYPAAYPQEIVAFSESRRMHAGRADDAIVGAWARAYKRPVWATVPCLVQHRDEMASVMKMVTGKAAPHRLAAWYVDDGDKWARHQPLRPCRLPHSTGAVGLPVVSDGP